MNFSIIGILSLDYNSIIAYALCLLSHGIISSAMFYIAGISIESLGIRIISLLNNHIIYCPLLGFITLLVYLSNIAFPVSINFIIELLLVNALLLITFDLSLIIIIYSTLICSISSILVLIRIYLFELISLMFQIQDLYLNEFFVLLLINSSFIICLYL